MISSQTQKNFKQLPDTHLSQMPQLELHSATKYQLP